MKEMRGSLSKMESKRSSKGACREGGGGEKEIEKCIPEHPKKHCLKSPPRSSSIKIGAY